MNRRILVVVLSVCLVVAVIWVLWRMNNGTVEGTVEVPGNGSPVEADLAGCMMILSYNTSASALNVVHNVTSPCGNATWTRTHLVRLGQEIAADIGDGEHHVIIGVKEGTPRYVWVRWKREKGQFLEYREIQLGVVVTPYEPDIILFDCRTVPPLHYTPNNITLARTLSNVSDEEMDYLLMVANMTPEERQQGRELLHRTIEFSP